MTIPSLIEQCKTDFTRITKGKKHITGIDFRYEKPLSVVMEHRELSTIGPYQIGKTIVLTIAYGKGCVNFYTPELTETEIVEVLYPPIEA